MKKLLLLTPLLLILLASCSKKDSSSTPSSTTSTTSTTSSNQNCYLVTDLTGIIKKLYKFDSQNRLYKISHGNATIIYNDSVIYNAGQVAQYLNGEKSLALTFDINGDGNVWQIFYYDAIINPVQHYMYTYNGSKQLVRETYRSKTDDSADYTYKYDANGNVSTAIIYTYKTKTTDSVVVQYDSYKSMYRYMDKNLRIGIQPYYLRGANNPVKITTYDSKGNVKYTDNYSYTYDGSNVSKLDFTGNSPGSTSYSSTYSYDCK